MKVRNVLVFPAGSEIGLEILQSLKDCKEVRVFGAGQDVSNHAKFCFPEYHILPSIHEKDWLPQLRALCEKLSIDYIFPAYDDVIVALSRAAAQIPAAVVSSPALTCEITRSKSATYRRLHSHVKVPRIYPDARQATDFPLLVKPDKGQGSSGIRKVSNKGELLAAIHDVPGAIICEYLPGEEYTVDCFSDRDRGLLFAGARIRRRTRGGISVNTETLKLPEVHTMASVIGRELKLWGAWFFQLKRASDGQLTLLEVGPRIAGSMAAHRVLGVNFPLLSIFEHERAHLTIRRREGFVELDRALSNRYIHDVTFGVLYVDLDDTLILNGQVNTRVIKLIFQCINQRKPVKLLTRHRGDLARTLEKYRLNGLFDEIVHIGGADEKASCITESNAILIDDSFSERMAVTDKCGIATFDCSMIEMLTEQAEYLNGLLND